MEKLKTVNESEVSVRSPYEYESRSRFDNDGIGGRVRTRREPKSIVLIALRHGLDPLLLTDAILEAYRKGTHHLEGLEITYRKENKGCMMLLLTENGKVICQFPFAMDLISHPDFLRSLVQNVPTDTLVRKEPFKLRRTIDELRFGMRKINVGARIVELPPKRLVITEYGQFYVSNATIADATGTIRLSLWNAQIEKVHVGDNVEIENCRVYSFQGEQQLRISRNGAITVTAAYDLPSNLYPSLTMQNT